MPLWLPCLLKELNLTEIVKHGWPTASGSLFNTPKLNMTDVVRMFLQVGDAHLHTKALNTGHERIRGMSGEAEELLDFESIKIVNEIFKDDFLLGGYPFRSKDSDAK